MVSLRRLVLFAGLLAAVFLAAGSVAGAVRPVALPESGSGVLSGLEGALPAAIRGPDGYVMPPLALPDVGVQTADAGSLRAVVIAGDVGDSTATFRADMEAAATALEAKGVTVVRFYYGVTSFSWGDIVAAAQGANFLLYTGHGVYWGGTCVSPTSVGGFYLGPNQFVTPDAIRNDLAGQLADDAVVILTHACYSAGATACDPSGTPSMSEAQRRVTQYAAPFVDLGMQAYFANNFYGSARDYVNGLLETAATRDAVGDIFRAVYPNAVSTYHDLSYPATGYDLWLNGTDGDWDHAFVGIPAYVFGGDQSVPELGGLPATVGFLYSTADTVVTPISSTIVPLNVGTDDLLNWSVSKAGAWFSVAPAAGITPGGFAIEPGTLTALGVGTYTGTVTVTVTDPVGTEASPQVISVTLQVTTGPLQRVYLPVIAH